MLQRRARLYRLYPTDAQAETLGQWVGAVRCVYNLALEQRSRWYRPGRKFNFATQCREVTRLRAEVDWLRAVPVHPLQQAIRDLDKAYRNWWAGRAGAPTPRKRGGNDSLRFPDPNQFSLRRVSRNWGEIRLPKLGAVKFRWCSAPPGEVRNVTVSRSAAGTVDEPGRRVRQKSGLNRSILDQGWYAFRAMLTYKLADRGRRLVAVDPRNTSRTCEACGHVSGESRNGLRFVCVGCGFAAHADVNAARNILRRAGGTGLLPVEGCRQAPVETGTTVSIAA